MRSLRQDPMRFQSWPLALGAALLMSVHWIDRQAFVVLSPTLTTQLHISDREYGWLSAAFSVSFLIAGPLAGAWLDRVGARVGLAIAVAAWSSVSAAHALAAGFASLVALRLLLGATESPSFPGALQTVRRALGPASRSAATGIIGAGAALGAVVAPIFTIAVATRWGWRAGFFVTAASGLLWIPLWLFLGRSPDARTALARSEADPEAPLQAMRPAELLRPYLAAAAIFPSFAILTLWPAKFYTSRYGVSQADVAPLLAAGAALYSAGAIGIGALASRIDRGRDPAVVVRRPKRLLFAISAAVAVAAEIAMPLATGPVAAASLVALAAFGCGGALTLTAAELTLSMPPGRVATATGAFTTVQSIALITANPVIGEMVARTGGYSLPFLVLAAWTTAGTIIWLAVVRPATAPAPELAA